MNQERRDHLRDAAIEVLANAGGRGLTHRAVDAAAGVPSGTAKNYFPTRDALLRGIAERCVELYRRVPIPEPTDREGLVAMLRALLDNVAGPGRARLLAISELRCEAARKPWLAAILDEVTAADFIAFEHAQRAAGLPVTPARAAAATLALQAAIPHLLAAAPDTMAAAGLNDHDEFVRNLLDALYDPDQPTGLTVSETI
ncbi:TetR/AcrR family transcriptional regulator [Actinomadura sp. SCN-SB]|uniref:TetR/AcrR family transcriptional regulator n=1 Tax=Actinomadura sp. SCN-SB TaxID=3373092 RepID=UPI0037536210